MSGRRRRVLVSAYACAPGSGSEPGLGWAVARGLADEHDVWVITRENNAGLIEAALADDRAPLHPVYYDLPGWARFWKRGPRGARAYYDLWQRGVGRLARGLHVQHRFHLAHHVTFAKCWAPSFLGGLGIPFIWGPLGGGDSTPPGFLAGLPFRGRAYEAARAAARRAAARTPALRRTARQSAVALATTPDTGVYLRALGARDVRTMMQAAIPAAELAGLVSRPIRPDTDRIRFVCAGSLLPLKGFHLAVEAFARSGLTTAELEIYGQGSERGRLLSLGRRHGIGDRLTVGGQIPRGRLLDRLAGSRALLHPALHDSSPWICAEAMALGVPVVCLDLTGPAVMVPAGAGIRVDAPDSPAAVRGLAKAIRRLGTDPALRREMGAVAQSHAERAFSWDGRGRQIGRLYDEVLRERSAGGIER